MKKLVVFLPVGLLGLLGGLLTCLGGLAGKVAFSVLLLRSISAVVICIIVLFGLILFLSKNLFHGADLFSPAVRPKTGGHKRQAQADPQPDQTTEDDNREENLLTAADNKRSNSNLNTDNLANKIARENPQNSRAREGHIEGLPEGPLRDASPEELANLIRYSINNEEL